MTFTSADVGLYPLISECLVEVVRFEDSNANYLLPSVGFLSEAVLLLWPCFGFQPQPLGHPRS